MQPLVDPRERYELREKIGTGAFGAVFRAVEIATGQVVAAKIIDVDQAEDEMQDIQQVRVSRCVNARVFCAAWLTRWRLCGDRRSACCR